MTGGQATALADLTGTLTPAGEATWDALAELAAAVPVRSWAVVGGQMVALHAAIGGVAPPRLTTDGDVVVDVRAHRRRRRQPRPQSQLPRTPQRNAPRPRRPRRRPPH